MRIKSELYKNEQINIINKLIIILNLNINNSIILYDLDNNEDLKTQILFLIPEIKKYFRFDCIHGVRNTEIIKRPYLSIIKNLLKIKYNIVNLNYYIKKNNIKIKTKKYIFLIKS